MTVVLNVLVIMADTKTATVVVGNIVGVPRPLSR